MTLGILIEGSFLLFANPGAAGSDCGESLSSVIWELVHIPVTALLPMERDSNFLIASGLYSLLWAALFYAILFQPIRPKS